jgi:hypothetical protein
MWDRKTRCAALLATQLLLGGALANILKGQDDVELIGPQLPRQTKNEPTYHVNLAFETLVSYND